MHTQAQAQASTVQQALAVEGGHLFLGLDGTVLRFAPGARVSGFPCEAVKAVCLAAGLPVIDCRAVPFRRLYAVVVEGPMVAVGKPPDPRPWHSLSDAPLAHVAAFHHAIGAAVFNVPGVHGPGAGAAL